MRLSSVTRQFTIPGTSDTVSVSLSDLLVAGGLKLKATQNGSMFFSNQSLTFSSKRPLTCISTMRVSLTEQSQNVTIHVDTSFTKIKVYTIAIIAILCFVLPAFISYVEHGIIDIPFTSYIGIPIGVLLHYHVRWRVFLTVKRLIYQAGE